MSVLDLIARLREAGIRVSVRDGKLIVRAERGKIDDTFKAQLGEHKADIIALLSKDSEPTAALQKASRDQPIPLSFAQQRLWFLDELEPGTPVYNMPFALHAKGPLDNRALQAALNAVVARHESLRTVFSSATNEPAQTVLPGIDTPIAFEKLPKATPAELNMRARAIARTGFDLSKGPLLRLHVLSASPANHMLVLVMHHIVSDLWSIDVLFRDLSISYAASLGNKQAVQPELNIQYGDYAVWQRQRMTGSFLHRQLAFWREHLKDAPPVLEIPLDFPRPPEPGYRGRWLSTRLPATLLSALEFRASAAGCTLFMFSLATFVAMLSRYSGAKDLVVGTPISGREHSELEQLVGFFLNTLALRFNIDSDMSFSDLLKQVKHTALGAYDHQGLPFEKLVEDLQPERDMSHTPVFQHMFIWQDSRGNHLDFSGLNIEPATLISHDTAKFDLTLSLTHDEEGLEAGVEFNTELFSDSTIKRLIQNYARLLAVVARNPNVALADLGLATRSEQQQVLEDFNNTASDFGEPVCVHRLVEAQVVKTPDAIAVCFAATELSYQELNTRANALAHALVSMGAGPGTSVAISCERSVALAVAALAVLKSGACYVAVDPNYPAERIREMLSDSEAAVVLTQSAVAIDDSDVQRLNVDEFDFAATTHDTTNLPDRATPADPLYCIYTSGSTGKPKGVELSHAGLANLLQWQCAHPNLGKAAPTLQFASFSFDVSFQELFSTWATGGSLYMVSEELRQDLPALATFIKTQSIERLYLPFAALQPLAESMSTMSGLALQDIVVAGEQLLITPELRALFSTLDDARLHNQYGPSETHVVTAVTLQGEPARWPALPSIGAPIANTRCYILDDNMQPLPPGLPGELWLGGRQVALGYRNRPELNAERFQDNPFADGDRLYRSGDRARWLDNGEIGFLGRSDDQLKWRGFRIEPGELETALLAHPHVQQAAVMLREDAPGVVRLVAYIAGADKDSLDTAVIKQTLRDTLPDYMLPSVIVALEQMPLTPSGKIARRRLPLPPATDEAQLDYVAPSTPTEKLLADVWREILGLEKVGIHDDFFELGGHSLLATRVVNRIRGELGTYLPLKYLFRYSTPKALAGAIDVLRAAQVQAETRARSGNTDKDGEDREEFSL